MEGNAVNGWLERLRREIGRLGKAGVVGIALTVFAAAFYISTVRPGDVSLAELREEASTLEGRLRASKLPGGRESTPEEQLAAFYAFFPAAESSPDWLKRMYAAADSRGVVLQSGEYRLIRTPGEALARYEITLPLKGSYSQIRGFVADVLAAVPAAALEEVNLRREGIESPRLDARVRFTLYLGGGR
jgi:hypothetical protein